jgi:23S rRNA (adenine2503-C2)-methyltransferase
VSVPTSTLLSTDRRALTQAFERNGLSAHQAAQCFKGLHRLGLRDIAAIPELSDKARAFLKTFGALPTLTIDDAHRASDGTVKLRVKTSGGELVESVLIPAKERLTLCVSSQAGCAAACGFCHTGTMGLLRNLHAWEILEQFRLATDYWRANAPGETDSLLQRRKGAKDAPEEIPSPLVGERREERAARVRSEGLRAREKSPVTNIVFMGMGEPLHNELNVTQSCRILNDDIGPGFSRRHIVVSTAGVGNRIAPFWGQQVASLAVSLHATTDAVRDAIVPLNKQWNLAALKKILLEIPWSNRESVTIAYLLLDGVNDTQDDARRLGEWIQGLPAKVNLLEFNPFPGSGFKRASPEKLAAFRQWLNDFGVFNTLRQSRGQDAMAACGQLATASRRAKKK